MKHSCWIWMVCALFSAQTLTAQTTARRSEDLALADGSFVEMMINEEWLIINRYQMDRTGTRKDLWSKELPIKGEIGFTAETERKGPLICLVLSFDGEVNLPDGAILSKGGSDLLFLQIHEGGGLVRADCLGGAGDERVVGREWVAGKLHYYVVTQHSGGAETLISGGTEPKIVLVPDPNAPVESMTETSSGTGIPGSSDGDHDDGP